jgi:hypothetical protein
MTAATVSIAQKLEMFRGAARERLERQANKMKATSSNKFQNLLSDKMLE